MVVVDIECHDTDIGGHHTGEKCKHMHDSDHTIRVLMDGSTHLPRKEGDDDVGVTCKFRAVATWRSRF